MKKIILIMALFLGFAGTSLAQTTFLTRGSVVSYDTTGQFAAVTLTGNKGYLKYAGTVTMREGLEYADSLNLFVELSDSLQYAVYLLPVNAYKTYAIGDTVGRSTPAGQHLWHVQLGAGSTTIPWYRLKTQATDLLKSAKEWRVYIWINKVAGLHTYGTASTGKAAGNMKITAVRYF